MIHKRIGFILCFLLSISLFSQKTVCATSVDQETYTGDDSYSGNDNTTDTTESDTKKKNGSPFEEGVSDNMLEKYRDRTEPAIIDSVTSTISVNENNTYDVTQDIRVYYNTEKNHKVTMSIPLNNLNKSDNDTVENVSVSSDTKNTSFMSNIGINDCQIILLDKNKNIITIDYKVTYTYVSRGDKDSSCDIFKQNIISFVNTPVENLSFKIKMPKNFKSNDMAFTDGNGNKMNPQFYLKKTTISGNVTNEIVDGKIGFSMSVDNGYFKSTSSSIGLKIFMTFVTVVCWICMLGGLAFAVISYMKSGYDEAPEPISQKKPLTGLTAIDIIVAMTGGITTQDLMLYFIDLANEGYVGIQDTMYRFQKKRDPIIGYRFVKLKDYDGNDKYMDQFMKIVFKDSDIISPEDIKKNITIRGRLNTLRLYIQSKGIEKLWLVDESRRKMCTNIGLIIPLLFSILFSLQNLNLGFGIHSFSLIYGPLMTMIVYMVIKSVDQSMKKRNVAHGGVADSMTWIYVFLGIGLLLIVTGMLNKNMFMTKSFTMTAAYFVESILIYCSCNLRKRTDEGLLLSQKILGLRNYLTEADELEMKRSILKDEQYAYEILPIAIATDITTDGWLAQMDGCRIDNPKWYESKAGSEFRLVEFMEDWNKIITVATNVSKEEIKRKKKEKKEEEEDDG